MIPTRLMPMGRGGKRLPYDAEVEYLESTGTQYIDTGVVGTATIRFDVDAAFLAGASNNNYIGQTFSGTTGTFANRIAFGVYAAANTWYAGLGNLNGGSGAADSQRHAFSLNAVAKTFSVDGSAQSVAYTSFAATPLNIVGLCLFGRGLTDTGNVSPYALMRVWSCQIYDNGVLVRDFIPVRIGTTGYLYDRVSGQLFGNQGTGAFVVGADK